MRVFRPTWTRAQDDGERVTRRCAKYHVTFKDHGGTWRRLTAFTDRAPSEALGRRLMRLAALRAAGEPLDGEMARWVDNLADEIRDPLIEWGVLDRRASMATRPLAEHVEEFESSLLDAGNTRAHVELLVARLRRVLDGCGFGRYGDIEAADVERFLAGLRADGLSIRTSNFYLRAVKQFCRWMVRNRRAHEEPLTGLRPLNAETDRRLTRRAASPEELRKLLAVAEAGPQRYGMSGPERGLLYLLAVETGLRANELRTLTRSCFDLDGPEPSVTVEAVNSKHRRRDVLPLLPGALVNRLRERLADKAPAARLFRKLTRQTADMLRADLAAAGIAVKDDRGEELDFHALRVTFITGLARAKVHPKIAQTLARHSTITLTMDVYSRVSQDEQRAALASRQGMAG